ncbi:MAG: peptidoglycan glycosyltransferase FtsI [Succinivibrionaceae bacterium]|nr:peptidoglycan glycosyltransferase FtsI [Succinivibrionaceae bacterium]
MSFSIHSEADTASNYSVTWIRRCLVWLFVLVTFSVLVARLAWLQILDPDFLIKEGNSRVMRNYSFEPARGVIEDREGKLLAISVPVKTVLADPKVMHEQGVVDDAGTMSALAAALDLPVDRLAHLVGDPARREVRLKRYLSLKEASALQGRKIPGLRFIDNYQRVYPTGAGNAHLVGYLNGEGRGVYGVESGFNSYLSAEGGSREAIKDLKGNIIEELSVRQEGKVGGNLVLSVDNRLQSVAADELERGVLENNADYGTLSLVDVQTGEILAMATYPSFDPNNRERMDTTNARNRVISDVIEPGSTVKPLVALAGLEQGVVNWREVFDTRPFIVDGKTMRDSHAMDSGTLADIIRYSSNTGMVRIAQRLGHANITDMLARFGFGEETGTGLPGEERGHLNATRRFWSELDQATLGYGYGFNITNLQLVSAYATIANGGVRLPLSVLKIKHPPRGVRVASERHVRAMATALEGVVQAGTGSRAAIDRYRIAGKTGTARIAARGGYGNSYVVTFAGFAPVSNPRFAAVVVITNPKVKNFYGGAVSGPVFSSVMAHALQLYNVPPDR